MKTFFAKSVLFVLLQLGIFAAFWNPALPYEKNYLAATIDKHQRLKAAPSPRLILIGGSNLSFGISSPEIERSLGLPLVNMGLTCHMGIPMMLEEVRGRIRPGDVVVLSLEHISFDRFSPGLVGVQLAGMRPLDCLSFPGMNWKEIADIHGLPLVSDLARRSLIQRFEQSVEKANYRRDQFDRQGSYIGHYGKAPTYVAEPLVIPRMDRRVREHIQSFALHCRRLEIPCFFSFPPYPAPAFESSVQAIDQNHAELRSIDGLMVLDSPRDHAYPVESFFDSAYHLTGPAAAERTRRLIASLRPHLKINHSNGEVTAFNSFAQTGSQ